MGSARGPGPRGLRAAVPALLVALLAATVTAGCAIGGGGPGDGDLRYGYAPGEDAPVTYQPDVVIVRGGGEAVRSAGRDGFTYVIDRDAPGADRVRAGKVMFVTGEVAGRVTKVRESGDGLAVTLAPVALTEIVRDGRLTVDQPLDPAEERVQRLPDLLGEVVEPVPADAASPPAPGGAGTFVIAAPPIRLGLGADEPALTGSAKVGDWEVTASKTATRLGVNATHATAASGLKVGLDIALTLRDPRVRADLTVANGTIVRPQFQIHGIDGLAISVKAGAGGGWSDNKKARIELPVEIKQPILIGGFPATLKQTFKLLVTTAFSAKNATIAADGEWGLSGPIGLNGGSVLTPSFSVRKSVMQSLRGVSVGVEGIVVAAEFRFGLVVGLPVAGAGTSAGVVASIGLTNGSAAGRVGLPLAGPAVKCRGTTLVASVRAGVGLSVSAPLSKAIEHVLKVKVPAETDLLTKDIVNRTVVEPDVPLCRD